jgi:hypothetical protein
MIHALSLGGKEMSKRINTGPNPNARELREAERVSRLTPAQQKNHPSAVSADHRKLSHINTYGTLPEFYLDRPFICRKCGKQQIWKAKDQKWYYEKAKGHTDAFAVECHACRKLKKRLSA